MLQSVARLNANTNRTNLNCYRNPQNSKSNNIDEITAVGITQGAKDAMTKTHSSLFEKLCSLENLERAFKKAKKGKAKKTYVAEFEKNFWERLENLKRQLENRTYQPAPLKRFIIRDPKTRTIHASRFCDRVVHHALINILEPIYEPVFVYDSYASIERIEQLIHVRF